MSVTSCPTSCDNQECLQMLPSGGWKSPQLRIPALMWCSVKALRHSKHGMQWHLWEFKRKGKRKPQGYKPLSYIDFSSGKWVPRAGLWVFCIPMAWDCPSSNGPAGNICWMNKKKQLPVTKYVFSFHKRMLLCMYVCISIKKLTESF